MAKAGLSVVLATDSRDPSGIGHHMLTLAAGLARDCRVALVFPDADGGPAFAAAGTGRRPRRRRDRHRGRGLFSRRSRGAVARCAACACGHRLGGAGTCGVGPRVGRRGRPHRASALAHHRSRAGGGLRAGGRERGRLRFACRMQRPRRGSGRSGSCGAALGSRRFPTASCRRAPGRRGASPARPLASVPRRRSLLCIARFTAQKDHGSLIEACALLRAEGRMVRLVAGRRWAGSGRPARRRLRAPRSRVSFSSECATTSATCSLRPICWCCHRFSKGCPWWF